MDPTSIDHPLQSSFVRQESMVEKIKHILSTSKYFTGLTMILLIVGLAGGLYLSQQNSDNQQHASANYVPPDGMGIYNACGTSSSCLSQLDTISQAGFKEVLDYSIWDNASISDVIAYAQRANQDHIKIIWSLKDMYKDNQWSTFASYPKLTATCGCSNKIGLATYLVNQVKNLPATWGYYIADEPTLSDHSLVATLGDAVHTADPNRPRLIIRNDSFTGVASSSINLNQYTDTAEVLGEDYYPVSYGHTITATGDIANEVQYVANTYHREGTMVLEVNSGNATDLIHATAYPSQTQMEEMLTMTLQRSQPRLVLWYWYTGTPQSQWNNLLNAISYVTSGNTTYHECAKQFSGGCGSTYPYFTDVTVVKSPDGSGGYSYACTTTKTASPGECSYSATDSCSTHGGLKQQYPQCSRTVGGCDQNFASGVLLQIQQCNDGTYLCPVNLAQVVAGQCGIAGSSTTPTLTPPVTQPVSPTPTSIVSPSPTLVVTPTPTPSNSYHQCSQTIGGCAMNYPYFDDLTIVKSPNGAGGYTYACTSPVLASPGECSYPDTQSCSSHGGLTNQYSQCAKTIGGCDQNFEKGVLLTVQHCNDGTYLCPANLAKVVPGQCGVAIPTPTDSMSPTPSDSSTPAPSDSPSPSGTQLVGDINGDGKVDILDYNILISCYNVVVSSPTSTCPNPKASDLDGSGIVDGVDYNILLRAMNQGQ